MANLLVSTLHDQRATPAAAIAKRKCPESQTGSLDFSMGSEKRGGTGTAFAMPSCTCASMLIFYFHELWREYSIGSLNNESGRIVVERGYCHDAPPCIRRERTVTDSSRKTVWW